MTKKLEAVGVVWPATMAPVAEHLRAHIELMTKMNLIVSRAMQSMASRQGVVLTEAVSDMTSLMSAAMPNPNDPAATTRAYAAYVERVMQRGMAQLHFSVEVISEMSASTLDLAGRRLAAGELAGPEAAPGHHHAPAKK